MGEPCLKPELFWGIPDMNTYFLRSRLLPLILIACGLVLCAVGLYRGEGNVVLKKAIRICLECIGIG
jgi:hypothetical protein